MSWLVVLLDLAQLLRSVCSLGLLSNGAASAAVIIGVMIVAPFMLPIRYLTFSALAGGQSSVSQLAGGDYSRIGDIDCARERLAPTGKIALTPWAARWKIILSKT